MVSDGRYNWIVGVASWLLYSIVFLCRFKRDVWEGVASQLSRISLFR